MAAQPAQITLNWISNTPGTHRVCYRIGGTGPYTCTVASPGTPAHPSCPGGGLPCSYVLDIMVDNETCDVVAYDGYVQPTCEDLESLANRTPWNVNFTPDPACDRWEVTCEQNGVGAINIIGAGSGYTPGSNPTVTITGTGTGATALATVDGTGTVVSIGIIAQGSGYTSPPVITIAPPPSGTTATATSELLDCARIDIQDCTAYGPTRTFPIAVGDSVYMCGETAPAGFPDEYSVTANGKCLCDCTNVDINNTGISGVLNITYIDCITQLQTSAAIPAGNGLSGICIVSGSLTYQEVEQAIFNQVVNGSCDGDGI